jgi:tRNA pseudouridine55 synthase
VTEGDDGKFIGMGEMDGEGRVAPRRLVVEYPVDAERSPCDKQGDE